MYHFGAFDPLDLEKISFRSNDRTVLSWHWYCPLIGLAPDSGPYDPVTRALCDELLGPMAQL